MEEVLAGMELGFLERTGDGEVCGRGRVVLIYRSLVLGKKFSIKF